MTLLANKMCSRTGATAESRRPQDFSLLTPSVFEYQAIFFLAFLVYILLKIHNVKVVWELFLMVLSIDVETC
jgi:hypothetical protein